jgi:hypothetical protein
MDPLKEFESLEQTVLLISANPLRQMYPDQSFYVIADAVAGFGGRFKLMKTMIEAGQATSSSRAASYAFDVKPAKSFAISARLLTKDR